MVNPAGEIAPMGLANKQFDQLRHYQSEIQTLKCVSSRPNIQTLLHLIFYLMQLILIHSHYMNATLDKDETY
jgi:hypothetical protein